SAQLALEVMNGFDLGGRQLKIGRPNNYNASLAETITKASPNQVFIANISDQVTEEMVQTIFEAFGEVKGCALTPDAVTRKHKGCGYVEFADEAAAKASIMAMKSGDFELGGLKIRAYEAIVGGGLPEGMKILEKLPVIEPPKIVGNAGAQPYASALEAALKKVQAKLQPAEETASLEDSYSIGASQRYSIMQKLLRKEDNVQPQTQPVTNVIQLKNMVTKEEVDADLKDEISDECSKHGKVENVIILIDPAKDSDNVSIYVKFSATSEAQVAIKALNMRWFGGRRIEAVYVDEAAYAKFGGRESHPPKMSALERMCFLVEWFDVHAQLTRQYQLFYYMADNSIEMYDIKQKRTFLKKTKSELGLQDLHIGTAVNIYARQLRIVGYGDEFTERKLSKQMEKSVFLIKPHALPNMGEILDTVAQNGFTICRLRMVEFSRKMAEEFAMPSNGPQPYFGDEVGSLQGGRALAVEVMKSNAVADLQRLAGPANVEDAKISDPKSLRARYGYNGYKNAIHVSNSWESCKAVR
ncbi:Nucleoside diphosphate kinase 7, partial [Chytridiales sp. JEL 0842]